MTSELRITVRSHPAAAPRCWTLRADPPSGDHPDPAGACAALDAAGPEVFAPVPADRVCAQLHAGPETAEVEGSWLGRPVRARFRRTDSCEAERWDRLATVFTPTASEPSDFGPSDFGPSE